MSKCKCVQRHVPLPSSYQLVKVGSDVLHLCPTTYDNVRQLLTSFEVYGTLPPGSITKHYSRYVRQICFSLWKESRKLNTML